ncbi:hypothetical protein BH10ACT1_BH10ACT1_40880 [soil metagenome]
MGDRQRGGTDPRRNAVPGWRHRSPRSARISYRVVDCEAEHVRMWVLFLLVGALLPGAACTSHTDCSCAGPGNLYYDLGEVVPNGGSVEVCFGRDCAVDPEPFRDDGRSDGSVRERDLGGWSTTPAKAVTVTVRRPDGSPISRQRVVASNEQGQCCGPYRELRT